MNPLAVICVSVLAIQVALLGLWVSIVRGRVLAICHSEAMDPASSLAKAVRAHGNAAEYAGVLAGPFLAASLLLAVMP